MKLLMLNGTLCAYTVCINLKHGTVGVTNLSDMLSDQHAHSFITKGLSESPPPQTHSAFLSVCKPMLVFLRDKTLENTTKLINSSLDSVNCCKSICSSCVLHAEYKVFLSDLRKQNFLGSFCMTRNLQGAFLHFVFLHLYWPATPC